MILSDNSTFAAFIIAAVLSVVATPAQTGTTETRTFYSQIYGANHGYTIWLPPGYASPGNTKRYPVIYELQNTSFASYLNKVMIQKPEWKQEEVILVNHNPGGEGCIYTLAQMNGGVYTAYEQLFVEELIPHIDSTFRTWPYRQARAIYGVSKAGGGCTRMATKFAYLFCATTPIDGVINGCGDGNFSSYPDKYALLPFDFYHGNIQANFPALEFMPIHMLAGGRTGSMSFWSTNIDHYGRFKKWGLKNIHIYNLTDINTNCAGDVICDGSNLGFACPHGNLCTDWLKDTAYNALAGAIAFAGTLAPPVIAPPGPPAAVSYVSPQTVTITHANTLAEIRYTLDGTKPKRESPRYTAPFSVDKCVMVVARAFTATDSSTGSASLIRMRIPPVSTKDTLPGVRFQGIAVTEEQVRDSTCSELAGLAPDTTAILPGFSIANNLRASDRAYGMIYEGLFMAEESGRYGFSIVQCGRMRGWVAGTAVFDRDTLIPNTKGYGGDSPFEMFRTGGQVMLQKGLHPIRLELFAGKYCTKPLLAFTSPGDSDTTMRAIPDSLWLHTTDPASVRAVAPRRHSTAMSRPSNSAAFVVDIRGRALPRGNMARSLGVRIAVREGGRVAVVGRRIPGN